MGNYFASVARSELQMVSDPRLLHRVQALCILVLYEASRGNGVQAWCDNGMFIVYIDLFLYTLRIIRNH
jgi:hypothetical protein